MRGLILAMLAGLMFLVVSTPNVLAQDSSASDAARSGSPAAGGSSKCGGDLLFGIPRWSSGLDFDDDCTIINFNASQIWLVVANVVRMLLGAAGLLAVVFMMVGGFMFIVSRGEPDGTKRARDIMLNSFWGLMIAIFASTIVSFIAGRFS